MTVCISLFTEIRKDAVERRKSIGISGLGWWRTDTNPILEHSSNFLQKKCVKKKSKASSIPTNIARTMNAWIIVVKWKVIHQFAIDESIKPLLNQKHNLTFIQFSKFHSNILWNPSINCSKASLNESCAENHSTDSISSVCVVHFPYGRFPWHWFGVVWKELHNRLTAQYEFSYNEVNIRIGMN